jgi:hypothetical protein
LPDSPDYARLSCQRRQHHRRYVAYVERCGLPCQECGGMGGYTEVIDRELGGPWYDCGFCEGTGRTTRHLRGLWLRWKQAEAKAKRRAA